jgi:hypothetical protein
MPIFNAEDKRFMPGRFLLPVHGSFLSFFFSYLGGEGCYGLTFTVILSISFYQVCSKRTRSYPYIQTVCVVSLIIHPL